MPVSLSNRSQTGHSLPFLPIRNFTYILFFTKVSSGGTFAVVRDGGKQFGAARLDIGVMLLCATLPYFRFVKEGVSLETFQMSLENM